MCFRALDWSDTDLIVWAVCRFMFNPCLKANKNALGTFEFLRFTGRPGLQEFVEIIRIVTAMGVARRWARGASDVLWYGIKG
jgi:hypothetical protein